jgi:hypothetical protein
MSAAPHVSLAWFPLVPRPRPPCLPLGSRIADLTALAASTGQHGTRQEQATCAAEILNKAALIASDCGIPGLARELCHRQYELCARAVPLPAWAVRLAMQPVLNIPRQLIRDGNGDDADAMLEALQDAALHRAPADIDGMHVSFGALTRTADGHREARTLTWTALLADGTRALAQAGHWKEAAERAAAHRGIGARLLDGRQAAILALLTNGQADEATKMTRQSAPAEPWEHAIQALLRVLCQRAAGRNPEPGIATMIITTLSLAQSQDPATALTHTRMGLTALDLASGTDTYQARALRSALITTANADGYAARDLLASVPVSRCLTRAQRSQLQTLISTCGLGAGVIPGRLYNQLTTATDQAALILTVALTRTPDVGAQ